MCVVKSRKYKNILVNKSNVLPGGKKSHVYEDQINIRINKPKVAFRTECISPAEWILLYSFASATPPAVMAKVASFSGMSGLEQRIRNITSSSNHLTQVHKSFIFMLLASVYVSSSSTSL